MKIYTKTGDKGNTSLFGGRKVSKANARVDGYGNIDELNSFIGLANCHISEESIQRQLTTIQNNLFSLGSEVATPADQLYLENGKPRLTDMIEENDVQQLENWIDKMEEDLPPLQSFILPGGGVAASYAHVCRTVCRRAERGLVFLKEHEDLRPVCVTYLNRLSDYFFVLARFLTKLNHESDVPWLPKKQ